MKLNRARAVGIDEQTGIGANGGNGRAFEGDVIGPQSGAGSGLVDGEQRRGR